MDEYSQNPETIPTKELLKQRRKADYERAKQQRLEQRLAEKFAKKRKKATAQAQKDAELWASLSPASELAAGDEAKPAE